MNLPTKQKSSAFQTLISALFLIAFQITLTGCSELNQFREAQRAFSTAASQENILKNNLTNTPAPGNTSLPAVQSASISAAYASVISSLNKLENSNQKKQLEAENLWGTALILKAMAYWRLQKYEKALIYQEKADAVKRQLGERDRTLVTALPGLIINDEQYNKLQKLKGTPQPADKAKQLQQEFSNAMTIIDQSRKNLTPNHPMHTYLIFSHLAAYKNLLDACELHQATSLSCGLKERCQAYKSLISLQTTLKEKTNKKHIINNWQRITGISPKKPPKKCTN
jgi:tetratricopeptide (TPR) repeat protein